MSDQRSLDESLSATVPGMLVDVGPDTLPMLEGVPETSSAEAAAVSSASDLDLDLNLDIDFATAAMDTAPVAAPLLPTVSVPQPSPFVLPPVRVAPSVVRVSMADAGKTFSGTSGFPWQDRRVLVVSADPDERVYLRARLSLAKLVWVDEAATTTQANAALDAHRYLMAIFNTDSPVVDGVVLARRFRQSHPEAVCVVTGADTPAAGPLGMVGRWKQWQRERELQGTGVEWLSKPLLPKKVAQLFARVQAQRAALQNKPQPV